MQTLKKTPLFLIALILICIPISKQATSLSVFLLVINWFFIIERKSFLNKVRSLFKDYPLVLLYMAYIIGMIFTTNTKSGWFDLEIKLSFILLPIIFATLPENYFTKKALKNTLYSFISGNIVYFLICIIAAFIRYQQTKSTSTFYYIELSIFHHPSYSAMFAVFAICAAFFIITKRVHFELTKTTFYLLISVSAILLLFTFLLSSKAGIISLAFVFSYFIIEFIIIQKRVILGLILTTIAILALFSIIKTFPNTTTRIKTASNIVKSIAKTDTAMVESLTDGTSERLLIWKSSLNLIKNHPMGVGTGDIKDELIKEYKRNGLITAADRNYNCHNQYLQTAIAIGIPGLLILVLTLCSLLYMAIKKRFLLPAFFILIFGFNILVESMLETQDGVIFFAVFCSLFVALLKNNSDILPLLMSRQDRTN